jgi:ecdysteroid 2-hydroxylase
MKSSPDGLLQKMKSQHLSDDIIVRIFSDLIIGAGDTVSFSLLQGIFLVKYLYSHSLYLQTVYTMQWLLHSIARNQQLANALRESIQSHPNTMESPLVRGSLRETLRLYPVAPFIGRIFEQDAEIGGYKIPSGVLVCASAYTSGRDAVNFKNPEAIIPERWLRDENKSDKAVLKPHGTLPFAMGSRSCVGKKIASYQIHCLLTKV